MDAAPALARSGLYRILAAAFRYPEVEDLATLRQAAIWDVGAFGLGELRAAAAATDLDTLRARYVATFGHVTLPDCPLYETASEPADAFAQAQTLADIAGCYRAFGLVPRPGAGERVDHLSVELEFMHYLAYREAYALAHHGPAEVATLRDGQRRFLAEHLGRWAPGAARAIAARADGVLGAAARVLERFLDTELAGLGEPEGVP